jgi:hypothetical protein
MRRSDLAVNHIVRFTIQTGFVATAWALAALATWFLLPNISVYRIFDMTSGTIRTHVSVSVSSFHLFELKGVGILGHVRDASVAHPAT